MLDIKFIREHADEVRDAAKKKGLDPAVLDDLLETDKERREIMTKLENIRAEQKKAKDRAEGARLKEEFKKIESESHFDAIERKYKTLMSWVPNIIAPDVPVGDGENDNQEVVRWIPGEAHTKPSSAPIYSDESKLPNPFDFKPKTHIELGESLDIVDFEAGTKVAGFRGYYLKNDGVLLAMGVMMYAVKKMVEKGYAPMIPPTLVKEFALFGTGYFKFDEYDPEKDEIYEVATADKEASGEASKDKKFLVGTAEPSLLAYYADQVLKADQLPLKHSGYSQCYRSEIGSYGKDVKGMYRVHEFMKVEQVILAPADIELTNKLQEEMLDISAEMHRELGLPYRRLLICTGDLGAGKYRQFDTEAWLPGMNRWAETGSASNFLDWQSRRLNVKYVDANGDKKFVYMLNNTALPSPRIFIAILENYQTKDGKVKVPKVLQPFVGKEVIG
ncbi:MAG TPA: serine--tRNA ligase [Candidatus Paceibacterota bacterium]|nr:serine--tRNA ligase [Candidatus Paceibacterota bacterium]